MQIVQKLLILFLFAGLLFSCSRDKVMEVSCDEDSIPTYDNEVRPIINLTCAYAGCHAEGFSSGDYTSYEALEVHLNSTFIERVNNRTMPPVYASGPIELTDTEILILQCWAQGGYLEN